MEEKKIRVRLDGVADIMFNRFIDHSKEPRPPEQKFYLMEGNKVVLPGANIESFLFGESKPPGCAKRFEGKAGSRYAQEGKALVWVEESFIQLMNEGNPIVFDEFKGQFRVHMEAAVTLMSGGKVIKQEAQPRPVVALPWWLQFHLTIIKGDMNRTIDSDKLYNWFNSGGVLIALGTHRPKFGRFMVSEWENI